MQGQLCVQRADLLAVAECCDRDRAIHSAKLRRFQQRERRNALACGKLKGLCNQGVVLVPANFHLVGVVLAIIDKLGFHTGFSDQSI